ncbi:MAG: AraC family transcriptional regulator [Chloroflexota bacterium]
MNTIHQTHFQGSLVNFGTFRCHPSHPSFTDSGPIRHGHLIVFPRTCVRIIHEGGEPIVASPNVVMFYNAAQTYRRSPISVRGDRCEWFAFHPSVVAEAVYAYDPEASQRPEQPFSLTHGPSDALSYMIQRLAVKHVDDNSQVSHPHTTDCLQIEELLLNVLFRVVQKAFSVRGCQPDMIHAKSRRVNTRRAHAELVSSVQELIGKRFDQALTLEAIAAAVHASPFRLCRIFRQQTGLTIHQYQNQIRLRSALERIPDCHGDLTSVALELGYSSHSHFTYAFRRAFGITPSQLATTPASLQLRELSKNLIAPSDAHSVSSM